jgi:ferredoxin
MRIELDRDVCIGSATCVGFVPTVIKIGSDGHAILLSEDADGVDGSALAEAAANCPVEAIRLVNAHQ